MNEGETAFECADEPLQIVVIARHRQHRHRLSHRVECLKSLVPEGIRGALCQVAATHEELGIGVPTKSILQQLVGNATDGVLNITHIQERRFTLLRCWHMELMPVAGVLACPHTVTIGVSSLQVSQAGHVVGSLAASRLEHFPSCAHVLHALGFLILQFYPRFAQDGVTHPADIAAVKSIFVAKRQQHSCRHFRRHIRRFFRIVEPHSPTAGAPYHQCSNYD